MRIIVVALLAAATLAAAQPPSQPPTRDPSRRTSRTSRRGNVVVAKLFEQPLLVPVRVDRLLRLIQLLDGGSFDAVGLVRLAKAAGMRYVVPFLKHHGGYALRESSFTHRDSAEWGLKRDVAREFADASRASGLRYGAYVSLGEW